MIEKKEATSVTSFLCDLTNEILLSRTRSPELSSTLRFKKNEPSDYLTTIFTILPGT